MSQRSAKMMLKFQPGWHDHLTSWSFSFLIYKLETENICPCRTHGFAQGKDKRSYGSAQKMAKGILDYSSRSLQLLALRGHFPKAQQGTLGRRTCTGVNDAKRKKENSSGHLPNPLAPMSNRLPAPGFCTSPGGLSQHLLIDYQKYSSLHPTKPS